MIVGAVLVTLLCVLMLLASFGWGAMRGTIERRLSAAAGRSVTVASIRRVGPISTSPLLELKGVRVAQPTWAGRGDMLRIRSARIRIPIFPLLIGRVRPQAVSMEGARLALVRDAQGRANWKRDDEVHSSTASPDLGRMTLSDTVITIDDALRDRHFRIGLAIDAKGIRARGRGRMGGEAATLVLDGASVGAQGRWPFVARIVSPIVSIGLRGDAARPLDFGHFEGSAEAMGRSLHDLDSVIEAGLPETQPFTLRARVTHDRPTWALNGLAGRIGRSDVVADLAITKPGGRTLITGDVRSDAFDFDDLANDAQLAAAAAREARLGPRFFPATRIDLTKLRRTDAKVSVTLRHLLFKTPSAVRNLSTRVSLDDGVLTAAPLRAGLTRGTVSGSAIVRHASGSPLLVLDLALRGSRLEGIVAPADTATGALDGRLVLSGHGETVREAIGQSNGRIGIAARDGLLNRRMALIIGSDVGRALFTGKAEGTPLRCVVADFAVRDGIARPNSLVLDTAVSRAQGSGSVHLVDERLALALDGRPKLKGGLHYDGAIQIDGTIKQPHATPPPKAASAGSLLKALGRAISGDNQPALAADADCTGLAARALR